LERVRDLMDAFQALGVASDEETFPARAPIEDLELPDLGPRFRLGRFLGAGSFGVVYEAFDHAREAPLAVKVLKRVQPDAVYRFKKEFRALADVSHRNLVQLYEMLSHAGRWFFTMERVHGRPFLGTAVGATPAEADDGIEARLVQLVRGVAALHRKGLLHRDIKPSNVLLTQDGRVVLLDFGLVHALADSSHDCAEIAGTPAYIAPEQAAGHPVPASDWYSVGVMLYEWLTGARPFTGPVDEVMRRKQTEDARPPTLLSGRPTGLTELCLALVARDPSHRPSGDEILQRLSATEATVTPFDERPVPFAGREAQLSALRGAYEQAREGAARIVHVYGESGMGKTALVQRFLKEIVTTRERPVVLFGRCHELESVPFKALDGIIDDLSHHLTSLDDAQARALLPPRARALARLFPVLSRVRAIVEASRDHESLPTESIELRRSAVIVLRQILERLCRRHPLVLVIDDVHWGDSDSAQVLSELFLPPTPAFLLIAAYRSDPAAARAALAFLPKDEGTLRRVELGPLSHQEALSLSLSLLPEDHDANRLAADIVAEGTGSPLFIDTLVRYSRGATAGGRVAGAPAASLDAVIGDHVATLPSDARQLLEVLAIAGGPVAPTIAQRATGRPVLNALALLRQHRLIRTRAGAGRDEIEAYHDRIREALATRLPTERARQLHERLALTLQDAGDADPELLCVHFRGAGRMDAAAHYSALAARRAASALAFDHAARLFQTALDLLPACVERRRELLPLLGETLANAGRGAESAAAYRDAATLVAPPARVDLLRRAAQQLLTSGRIEEGRTVLGQVVQMVGLKLPATPFGSLWPLLKARARLWFRGLSHQERPESAISQAVLDKIDTAWCAAQGLAIIHAGRMFQTTHLLLALRAGEPYRVARAIAHEALRMAVAGTRAGSGVERTLDTARRIAERCGNPHATAFTRLVAGSAAYLAGRWGESARCLDDAEELLRVACRGVAWELDSAHIIGMLCRVQMGDLLELARRLPSLQEEARARGDLYAEVMLSVSSAPWLLLAEDRAAEAVQMVNAALARWTHGRFDIVRNGALYASGEMALYRGDAAAAWAASADAARRLSLSPLMRVQVLRIRFLYLRARSAIAAAAAHDGKQRRTFLARAESDAARLAGERSPWGNALASLVFGLVRSSQGRPGEAAMAFRIARIGLLTADMGLHAAAAGIRLNQLTDDASALDLGADFMREQRIVCAARVVDMLAPLA
jgi:predicted Ser/Thr protein kinase